MTVQANSQSQDYQLLRGALRGNSIFSTLSGVLFLLASGTVASFLGAIPVWIILALGVGLLGFAALVFMTANQSPLNRQMVQGIIVGDVLWVVASWILLFSDLVTFTTAGWWAVAVVADIVLVFAILQGVGLRRR